MTLFQRLSHLQISAFFTTFWPEFVLSLYFIYLINALTFAPIGKAMVGILFLIGLIAFIVRKERHYPLRRPEKNLLISFSIFSLISIVSFFYWPHTRIAQMHLEDYGTFILLIPLYLLLRQARFNFLYMLYLLSITSLLLGVVSSVQYVSMMYFNHRIKLTDNSWSHIWLRPSGGVNPMRYGAISLIMSSIAFNGVLLIKHKSIMLNALLFLSVFMGLVACFLANARGAFLALPFLLIMYGFYLYRLRDKHLLVILVLVGVCLLVGLTQNERVQRILTSVEQYQIGNSVSNLGARFDMFKAAIILIQEQPVWGYGLGSYLAEGKELRKAHPELHSDVGTWSNPHNEILLVLVEKGVVGLITLILLFAVSIRLFLRAIKRADVSTAGQQTRFYAMSGLSILLVYIVVGQSVALFQHDVFNHFFVLMILLFASQIRAIEYQIKAR